MIIFSKLQYSLLPYKKTGGPWRPVTVSADKVAVACIARLYVEEEGGLTTTARRKAQEVVRDWKKRIQSAVSVDNDKEEDADAVEEDVPVEAEPIRRQARTTAQRRAQSPAAKRGRSPGPAAASDDVYDIS